MSLYAVNGKEPITAWIPSLDTAGNGTTTLTDLVGSNNGTLTNMDPATDWVKSDGKYALDFDGFNDYVSFGNPDSLKLNGDVSVSAWVYPRSTNRLAIVANTASATTYFMLVFSFSSSSKFSFWNTAAGPTVVSPATYPLNSWYHVVATRNSSDGVVLYVNGEAVVTSTSKTGNGTTGNEMVLGRSGSFNSFYSSSLIDDTRIWGLGLDATDSTALYAAGRGGITNPPPATYFTGIRSVNSRRRLGT